MFQSLQKTIRGHHLLALLAVVIVAYAIYRYSSDKASSKSGMTDSPSLESGMTDESAEDAASVGPTVSAPAASAHAGSKMATPSPSELLPADAATPFSTVNPRPNVNNQNFLDAGRFAGVNTVGSSMRNANLQIRSEPANPQTKVGPWNNTTIEPDLMRQPLDCEK